MASDDDFSAFTDMLDEDDGDSMPVYGWRMLMFIDAKGTEWFKWQSFGSPAIGTSIGILELVKHKMLTAHDVLDTIAQIEDFDSDLERLEADDDD